MELAFGALDLPAVYRFSVIFSQYSLCWCESSSSASNAAICVTGRWGECCRSVVLHLGINLSCWWATVGCVLPARLTDSFGIGLPDLLSVSDFPPPSDLLDDFPPCGFLPSWALAKLISLFFSSDRVVSPWACLDQRVISPWVDKSPSVCKASLKLTSNCMWDTLDVDKVFNFGWKCNTSNFSYAMLFFALVRYTEGYVKQAHLEITC